ncbi:putative glycolipid-binding domain-containing protein [Tenuibacillus multivorans]|uniref:putative glycolipid-binding domain-containing protein n=1 Tax=Tenuibacillus multivorans TaxID=237069 RepID=UPI0021BFB75D|nr:putative glycolipid-binding domain-containing protein [Tenuibacillus multivorans]
MWENIEQFGCEHFILKYTEKEMIAKGTIISLENHNPHIVNYQVHLDQSWITKKLEIKSDENEPLEIHSDGNGHWFNREGNQLGNLSGSVDIDISATPFSNSLPINRFDWNPNQRRDFNMVYVSVPTLELKKVPQSYTYIERDGETRVFLYQCYDFKSYIYVDDNGLILNYPELFKRKY